MSNVHSAARVMLHACAKFGGCTWSTCAPFEWRSSGVRHPARTSIPSGKNWLARTGMMRSCVRAFAVPRRSGLSLRFGHAPRTFQHLRREEFCIGFLFREVSFTCYSLFKHRAGCPMHPSSFTFAMVFSSPEACDTAKVWSMFPRAAHRSQVSSSVCHQKLLICCGIHHGRRSEKFPD